MESQARNDVRSGAGRPRQPSRRAREAVENGNLEDPQPPKNPRGNQKRKHTDNENENDESPTSQQPQTRRKPEFAFATLPSNRTSKLATNVINLHANRDGIPVPKNVTPAKVVAGQRLATAAPHSASSRLSKESAVRLGALRNPYNTPSKSFQTQDPSCHQRMSGATEAAGSEVHGAMSQQRLVSSRPAPSTSGNQVRRQAQPMHSSSLARPSSPPLRAKPHAQDTPSAEPPQTDRIGDDAQFKMYSISASGRTWGVGQIPTSRVDPRDREASLPYRSQRADDDVFSDDDQIFDDYDSQPRAAAEAQAYGITVQNPRAVEMEDNDLDEEELREIAMDPDADLEEEEALADDDPAPEHGLDIANRERPTLLAGEGALVAESGGWHDAHPSHENQRGTSPTDQRDLRTITPSQRSRDQNQAPRRAARGTATEESARKKARTADYSGEAKQLLEYAATLYKVKLTSENAWPDKLEEHTWAKVAWDRAAEDLEIDLSYDANALPLITRYSWNLRGEIKTAARGAVQGAYGFKSATYNNAQAITHNQELVKMLLDNRAYKYDNPASKEGLYEGDIIQTIINRVYYKHARDDGVVHDAVYRPFPFRGIALVLTAIDCAINEWKTGQFQNVDFNEDYKPIYNSHHIDLNQFELDSGEFKIMTEICTGVAENGRFNAKVPVFVEAADVGSLSRDDIANAIAAYRARKQARSQQSLTL